MKSPKIFFIVLGVVIIVWFVAGLLQFDVQVIEKEDAHVSGICIPIRDDNSSALIQDWARTDNRECLLTFLRERDPIAVSTSDARTLLRVLEESDKEPSTLNDPAVFVRVATVVSVASHRDRDIRLPYSRVRKRLRELAQHSDGSISSRAVTALASDDATDTSVFMGSLFDKAHETTKFAVAGALSTRCLNIKDPQARATLADLQSRFPQWFASNPALIEELRKSCPLA